MPPKRGAWPISFCSKYMTRSADCSAEQRLARGWERLRSSIWKGLERDYGRNPDLAWELANAYARLGQSRGGAAASVGETRSGLYFAKKALELGEIAESTPADTARLDRLFEIYASLVPILQEARRPDEQRQVIDRLLRLAPKLEPIRQAQAFKELARHHETRNSAADAAEAYASALQILRKLSDTSNKPAGVEANLISTLCRLWSHSELVWRFHRRC